MSYTAKVNFERISEECFEVCDRIRERIESVQKMLDILEQYTQEDFDIENEEFINLVYNHIDDWMFELESILDKAQYLSRIGRWTGDTDDDVFQTRYDVKNDAYQLMRTVNGEAASIKPALYIITKEMKTRRKERIIKARNEEKLERQRVINSQKEAQRKLREQTSRHIREVIENSDRHQNISVNLSRSNQASGVSNEVDNSVVNEERIKMLQEETRKRDEIIKIREEQRARREQIQRNISELLKRESDKNVVDSSQKLLDSINDSLLKQFTYIVHLSNPNLKGDDLINEGIKLKEEAEKRASQEAEREKQICREKMAQSNVPADIIEKVMEAGKGTGSALEQIYQKSDEAIIGETMRKQSLQIILKSIKAQGFVVDTKNIRRKDDVVTLIAQKPGGEIAKFSVYIDGKFIYDFKGYEGQACQKDIEPFLADLQEIYGVDITESKEIWKNPDKIQTQKIKTANTRSGKA